MCKEQALWPLFTLQQAVGQALIEPHDVVRVEHCHPHIRTRNSVSQQLTWKGWNTEWLMSEAFCPTWDGVGLG